MTSQALVEHTFREQHGRVLAALINRFGDFTLAEDALQDALLIALEQWDREGPPRNPAAWITTVATRRAIDRIRRDATLARKQVLLQEEEPEMDEIPDERLKLMFTCCHPSLAPEAQVVLTLHTLGGLSTAEIARAFLVPVPTMAQRLTRAHSKIRDAGIPYIVPPAERLPERLNTLFSVIYLIFNEGYCATHGDSLIRQELCNEAIRLCRVLVDLLPLDSISAEARGLLALLLLHDSRHKARVNAAGELVLLENQDRETWDREEITEGLAVVECALAMGHPGSYQVQAAISALHAQATHSKDTDWAQIAELYGVLAAMHQSSIVEVSRAVAVGMAYGPRSGLQILNRLHGQLENYYPYHAARADLLRRTMQREAAADAYQQAIGLCQNALERAYLQRRFNEMLSLPLA